MSGGVHNQRWSVRQLAKPHSPSSVAGNLIVGPPMAVFDRIRDNIRDAKKDGHH
jgi:hypothetical protein